MCKEGADIVMWLVATNIVLSSLHWFLSKIKNRWAFLRRTQIDDRALEVVDFLLTMLNFAMANRRTPPK